MSILTRVSGLHVGSDLHLLTKCVTEHIHTVCVDMYVGSDLTKPRFSSRKWAETTSSQSKVYLTWSQVGLRKHHYEQSYWMWWNSSCAVSNPERWWCESAALNMPADLENSTVAIGLENVSFHSNPWERQSQRMLKLPHNCIHLTC